MAPRLLNWGTGLHQTFRLLPEPTANLRPFLEADGRLPQHLLAKLPFESARSSSGKTAPDPKRYRDGKQVYENAGLLYQGKDGYIHVTALGQATRRWLPLISEKNIVVLGRHAAYALAACQLRNPTGSGKRYDPAMRVFPFAFIWRAMFALGGTISSDELNRAIFRVQNEADLAIAIEKIKKGRSDGNLEEMGAEIIIEERKEDRIIPWMSIASFGWTLIIDKKSGGGIYRIRPSAVDILRQAAAVQHRHREFNSTEEYVLHLSRAAALPEDLR